MALHALRNADNAPRSAGEWVEALAQAAEDLAPDSLGFETTGLVGYRAGAASVAWGVLLPVVGEGESMHVGIFASPDDCRALAAAYLGSAGGDDLAEPELAEALGEIVNALVGAVRALAGLDDETLRCGLPVLIRGGFELGATPERCAARIMFGPIEAQLVVFRRSAG